jgi:hypothetical protein
VRAAGAPQTCENGAVMGHAERQERLVRDTYERAEDPSRTCNTRRLQQVLRSGADEACLPTPSIVNGRPSLTTTQLSEAQRRGATGPLAEGAAHELATHIGVEAFSHAGAALATRAGLMATASMLPPLAMALGIVLTAEGAMATLAEARHADTRDRAALSALAGQWQRYQCSLDANTRSILEGRMRAVARGIEFVRNGNLDDPFVQRQIESDPYIRLGVRTQLEARGQSPQATAAPPAARPGPLRG